MARRPRLQIEGASYHVMGRGNRRLSIFEDEYDRRSFDNVISEAVRRYKIRIFAACQMGNHYHFVLDTPRGNLSEAMGYINGTYAQESNKRYGRTGHLFEARFHSLVVQRERYFRRSCRYTVRNPVQAGIVSRAEDWQWSTYKGPSTRSQPSATTVPGVRQQSESAHGADRLPRYRARDKDVQAVGGTRARGSIGPSLTNANALAAATRLGDVVCVESVRPRSAH
jgi:REP element-mobilizing transposase RayT